MNTETCITPSTTTTAAKRAEMVFRPEADVFEFTDAYEIQLDLPGASADTIDAVVENGVLEVEAHVPMRTPEGDVVHLLHEYGVGDFRRRFRLGEDVDATAMTATYADGVLVLRLPKRPQAQARRIEVRSA